MVSLPTNAMELKSPDLREGAKMAIDQVYRHCGGLNISPQLSWSAGPEATVGYAITMIDIDVKPAGWVHWALVNIPANQAFIPRSAPRIPGARAIDNDFGNPQYDGPCPPRGSGPHRYRVTVWALKAPAPEFAPGATADDIVEALAKFRSTRRASPDTGNDSREGSGVMRDKAIWLAAFALLLGVLPADALELTSSEFKDGAAIPQQQALKDCGGKNLSPSLAWKDPPAGTKSWAITMIDLDVKPAGFAHWLVVDIPLHVVGLKKGQALKIPILQLNNDFGWAGYGGPCPPRAGGKHRYQFTIWALNTDAPSISPYWRRAEALEELNKIAIGRATLTGTYERLI